MALNKFAQFNFLSPKCRNQTPGLIHSPIRERSIREVDVAHATVFPNFEDVFCRQMKCSSPLTFNWPRIIYTCEICKIS